MSTLERRFLDNLILDDPAGHWMWGGRIETTGYGKIGGDGGKNLLAHRVSYEMFVGPIPPGLHIDHLCRTRACVNPAHLEPVTRAENNRRAAAAVTHCPREHEYTPENTARHKSTGYRYCRRCNRERVAAFKARARAAQ